MIRNHDQTLRKRSLYPTVGCDTELTGHRCISADPDLGRRPPVGHGRGEEAKGLFREGHVGIVKVAVDKVQRGTEELCNVNPVANSPVRPSTSDMRDKKAYTIQEPAK